MKEKIHRKVDEVKDTSFIYNSAGAEISHSLFIIKTTTTITTAKISQILTHK